MPRWCHMLLPRAGFMINRPRHAGELLDASRETEMLSLAIRLPFDFNLTFL
jgi:hypothetical protein